MIRSTTVLAVVIAAVALLAGAGAALADDGAGKRTPFRDAVAAKLGVTPAQLQAAITAAAIERIDAAVAAGKLTAERAAKLKEAIADGKLRKLRLGFHKRAKLVMRAAPFRVAAEYLGLPLDALKAELKQGMSLAEVATARGKSVSGLVDAMVQRLSDRLDKAVANGRISPERKQELLAKATERAEKLVAKQFKASTG